MDESKPKKSVYEEIEDLYGDQEEEEAPEQKPKAPKPIRSAPRAKGRRGLHPVAALAGILLALGIGAAAGWTIQKSHQRTNAVMVVVNGTPITHDEFVHRLDIANGAAALHQMVEEDLQMDFAKERGALPSNAEVEDKFKQVSADKDFSIKVFKARQTPDDIKQSIRLNMAKTNMLKAGVTVSDAEIRRYYDFNTDPRNPNAQFYRPETVLVAAVISNNPADIQKAQEGLAGGQPFETVAKLYSREQQTAARGGIVDPIRRGQSQLLAKFPALSATIFGLKPGQTTGPVKVGATYWLIRCLNKFPAQKLAFEAVKADCRNGALLAKGVAQNGKQMEADFTKFSTDAKVDVKWTEYTDAVRSKQADGK